MIANCAAKFLLSPGRVLRSSLLLVYVITVGACAPLHVTPPPGAAKYPEAIVILPGLGLNRDTPGHVKQFAESADRAGYEVYLADFQGRRSLDHGVEKLHAFLSEQKLERYDRVHVFAYILGGYTFNRFQQKYPIKNLGNVVYDRSPLQELAPIFASKGWLALPARIKIGPVVADLAATPYRAVPLSGSKVGLIVENRATRFIRARKDRALELAAPLSFDPGGLDQDYDAVIHVPFDHDEMYENFDAIGPELLHFFKHGSFTPHAAREPLDIDPFAAER